jgi:succinylglutamate desuccinylase
LSKRASYISDYSDDSFKRSYNVDLGNVVISHHALMRFIQREVETNNSIWSKPLVKLKRILTGCNWRELRAHEFVQFQQTDDGSQLYLNEHSGWMLILSDYQSYKVLVTILNINSPHFRKTQIEEDITNSDFKEFSNSFL